MTLNDFYRKSISLDDTPLMPALFVGHGSPMNAIEDNEFARKWVELGQSFPLPQAILCISAHWETRGTMITGVEHPRTIHDFYGFPEELYQQQYPANGCPALAERIKDDIRTVDIGLDYEWGLDHGTWSLLKYFYPDANIPVVQLSIDYTQNMRYHYDLAKELMYLRRKGVLVIGSGNMVHNLRMLQVKNEDFNAEHSYDWALDINTLMKNKINERDINSLIHYENLTKDSRLAIPTPEHYIPLLYIMGIQSDNDTVSFFNDKVIAGSLSMTSFVFQS
ncbi:4,5-DOPA dioxygenase extradiol [Dysgonomonas sp. OttesenSCG-928-M03]|nr:4,5-DOPA dioxygenase extradiol [Dysgonomonas sp. OttesenSCG-928-M03]